MKKNIRKCYVAGCIVMACCLSGCETKTVQTITQLYVGMPLQIIADKYGSVENNQGLEENKSAEGNKKKQKSDKQREKDDTINQKQSIFGLTKKSGRTYEETVEQFIDSIIDRDIKKLLEVYTEEYKQKLMEETNSSSLDEMIKKASSSIQQGFNSINIDPNMTYKITDTREISDDRMEVTVEFTEFGQTETATTTLIYQEPDWYMDTNDFWNSY